MDEEKTLQNWIKNNQARKKWENLENLLTERKELLNKIDISAMELDIQKVYNEQGLFSETEKLENAKKWEEYLEEAKKFEEQIKEINKKIVESK